MEPEVVYTWPEIRYVCFSPEGIRVAYPVNCYEEALEKAKTGWLVYTVTEKWERLHAK